MVLLALGVAYGALKNEQETMKANQITMKVTQERILDQLNAIESRLIRIESIMGSDLNTAGGRHRK